MRPASFAFLLTLLGACDFNYVEIEIESQMICIRDLSIEVPANAEGEIKVTLSKQAEQEEPAPGLAEETRGTLELPEGWVVSRVTLKQVSLTASAGIADLGFMDEIRVHMLTSDENPELPPVQLAEFVHGPSSEYNAPSTTGGASTILLEGDPSLNVEEYFKAQQLELQLDIKGTMPAVDWAINAEPCFAFAAEYAREL